MHLCFGWIHMQDTEKLAAEGTYYVDCYDSNGNLKWSDVAHNLVTNQGKNGMLDTYFAGSGYTGAWLMSLITAGTPAIGSTYATPIVTETTSSVIANRVAMAWTAASAGVKTSTTTSFAIIGTAT